jgi:topoisomerase IV subunit A
MAYAKKLFHTNFIEYASYVIKDRAIPHVDDGLKPVQRRILHTLFEVDDGKFHKVANVVGHCMKYHPHGDASIFSALVVVANKEYFIDKQGNFGNILTGDQPSAARYIECRVKPLAKTVLYNPELTEFDASYDGRNKEPVTFPAKIPVVLIQGAEGIAVGMSTRILPHNFNEVLNAMIAALKGEEFTLYPDFASGGSLDVSEYKDGMGKVLVRAKLDTSDEKRIVIREVPYSTTTESLINSIEAAAKKNKIRIAEINDYTSDEVEIEIKLARGIYSQEVVDALYAFTDCEVSISVNLLVIKETKPTSMTVTEVVEYHADRLMEILKKELRLEEGHLKDKLHARTLERIFVEERIYKAIEEMDTQEKVHKAVLEGFKPFEKEIKREITEEDLERLLRIPIRRISLYDINKARKEIEEIENRLKEIRKHLKNILDYAVGFLGEVKEVYGDAYPRNTKIVSFEKVDAREAAQRNLTLRYDGQTGYLGYGLSGGKALFEVSPYDRVLVIRKNGIYSVIDVPEKLFVDRGMLSCGLADKENLDKTIFTVVYLEKDTKFLYLKRCKIEQFILDKTYPIIPDPEKSKIVKLTTQQNIDLEVTYKPKPRIKVLEERFHLPDFMIKGVKAQGVRLSTKEVESVTIQSPRTKSSSQRPSEKKGSSRGKSGSTKSGGSKSGSTRPRSSRSKKKSKEK